MRQRARFSGAVALLAYLALATAYLAPPIAGDPTRRHIGGLFTDPQIFVWSFAWWPHAIAHGLNPFYTHAIWAPDGVNLAWTTSVPGLALPFAPLTLAFGPVFSYNVACIVMPALAAWTGFLLCRHVTRNTAASLVGGYLFGFSSYVLSAELSHIHTAAVFLLPLVALLVLRALEGSVRDWVFVVSLAAVLAWQATLSTEVLFMLTLALAVAVAASALLVREVRPRMLPILARIAGAYVLAAIIVAPFVYYVVTASGQTPNPGAATFNGDLLNFVVPTRASFGGWWSSDVAAHFPGNDIERGAYLGIPLLVVLAWYWLEGRRRAGARLLLVLFALAALATLGSWLTVDGHRLVRLPWSLVANHRWFLNVMPVRFSVFCALIAAVAAASWLAGRRAEWPRAALAALAILAIVPNLGWSAWSRRPDVPRLFTTGAYRTCIPQGANVIVFPVGPRGDSMIWQADAHFWFRMAGGYIAPVIPPGFLRPSGVQHLTTADRPSEVTAAAVLELARLKGVSTVVVAAPVAATWRPILRPLGRPRSVGGALVYRLGERDLASCAR
jgi:hypothetical protein